MYEVKAIYKAVEYAENHLRAQVTIADMAKAANYSLYHFCRLFNRITRHTPYDYLVRRRLSESAAELVEGRKKIIEIAFEFQFNSAETFIRAFKRMFNSVPGQYRKNPSVYPAMPPFTRPYLEHINRAEGLAPTVTNLAPLHLAGIMSPVDCNVEMVHNELKSFLHQRLGFREKLYGIRFFDQQCKTEFYFLGIVSPDDLANGPWVSRQVPGGEYTRFKHSSDYQSIHYTCQYIHHTWRALDKKPGGCCLEEFSDNNTPAFILI